MVNKDPLLATELVGIKALDEAELRVNRNSALKGIVFFLALLASYCGLAVAQPPESPLPRASPARAAMQCVLALAMLVEAGVDYWAMPYSRKGEEAYPLVRTAGKTAFLTTWILYGQTIEMVVAAVAEVMLVLGMPCPRTSSQFRGVFMTMSYEGAVFASTTGVMLTMLFLKFNYFEEKWRVLVTKLVEESGVPYFHYTLLGHVPSLPVAVLDIVAVRDSRFLGSCTPSLGVNVGVAFVFSASYFTLIHALWWASDYKSWPYPFLHDLDTIPKRLLFFVAVFATLVVVMLPLYVLM